MSDWTVERGDRFTYTTPSGREIEYTVAAVPIEPKYRHGHQGRFVHLVADEGQDLALRESDLLGVSYFRRVQAGERGR